MTGVKPHCRRHSTQTTTRGRVEGSAQRTYHHRSSPLNMAGVAQGLYRCRISGLHTLLHATKLILSHLQYTLRLVITTVHHYGHWTLQCTSGTWNLYVRMYILTMSRAAGSNLYSSTRSWTTSAWPYWDAMCSMVSPWPSGLCSRDAIFGAR